MKKTVKLNEEFWDQADKKWNFWKDLEPSLCDIQALVKKDKGLDITVSFLHIIKDIFYLLDPHTFKKGMDGRAQAIDILMDFFERQKDESYGHSN